jgi:hypothetical protein
MSDFARMMEVARAANPPATQEALGERQPEPETESKTPARTPAPAPEPKR